jgi:hypothetical protein
VAVGKFVSPANAFEFAHHPVKQEKCAKMANVSPQPPKKLWKASCQQKMADYPMVTHPICLFPTINHNHLCASQMAIVQRNKFVAMANAYLVIHQRASPR